MTVGDRIKKKRLELNLTQEELARKAGYKSRSSINKIESSRDLPLSKVKEVARILECSPSYLMGWMDNKDAIEAATIDADLTDMSEEVKGYALKLSKMSEENQKLVFQMIDKLS